MRMLLAILVLLVPGLGRAQEAAPLLLRLTIAPQGPVSVNQRVTVTLTALTPIRFVDAPNWPDLAVSGGRAVILPESATIPGTERVGAVSYAALQHSYSLFPATPGTLSLAPIRLALRVGGAEGQPVETSAATEALRIEARIPPGVQDVTRLVVAPSFQLHASVTGAEGPLHPGQAVTRHLRMAAEGTAAMLLPPPLWGDGDGVRAYPDPPVMQDRSNRGVLQAVREDSIAFVPQRAGDAVLPGFEVEWLEPASGRLQRVPVEALRLTVLPTPGAAADRTQLWAWSARSLPPLLGLVALAWWWWRRRHRVRREEDGFTALATACHADDAPAAVAALYRWADASLPQGGERSVAHLAALTGTPALARAAAELGHRLYGAPRQGAWRGAPLLDAARHARKALRRPCPGARAGTALPPLNPGGEVRSARLTQPRWAR